MSLSLKRMFNLNMKKEQIEREIKSKKGCIQKIKSKGGKMSIKICTIIDKCSCEDLKCCSANKKEVKNDR